MFIPEKAPDPRPIEGSQEAEIMILGDNPDGHAMKAKKPFGHGAETVLQDCIHQAGMVRPEVCITNFLFDTTRLENFFVYNSNSLGPSQIKRDISGYKASLWSLIKQVKPKVIVTLGELPCYILTGDQHLSKIRGYPYSLKDKDTGEHICWVIPSLHPGKMIWSNYEWRYYLAHDIRKARKIVENPSLCHPKMDIQIATSLKDIADMCAQIKAAKVTSWDIEVSNFHTSCMGFSWKDLHGVSVPIDSRWTELEEIEVWKMMNSILSDPDITKITQNGSFDVQFVAQEIGIFVKNYQIDTMISHSIQFPDFLKGLGFLGSIYTYHPYWKDELEGKSIKSED
jgi:uracil-DNA glycosylase family 4